MGGNVLGVIVLGDMSKRRKFPRGGRVLGGNIRGPIVQGKNILEQQQRTTTKNSKENCAIQGFHLKSLQGEKFCEDVAD